jgi:hypothetical protein
MNVNRELFRTELPKLFPNTPDYFSFWKQEKQRCIEGYWVSGIWMPGKLYFYINYATIKGNKKGSKVKVLMQPWLRDIEWEVFYSWEEARGFSGFTDDPVFTCNLAVLREDLSYQDLVDQFCMDYDGQINQEAYNNLFDKNHNRKIYVTPREYLRKVHDSSKGRPLYLNQAKNFFMMGTRGFGKSYIMGSGVTAHEWLFNGQTKYITGEIGNPSEIMVGAGDAKYSSETLSKTKLTLEQIPGAIELGDSYFPAPFRQQYVGTWQPGKEIRAEYKKKIGGEWKTFGSRSTIKHRTFKDNPFAANGLRPGVMLFEEIGMFDNLKESYAASVECQREGALKFGSMFFTGTGGDMNGGGTLAAYEMFYNPDSYDIIKFNDDWEHQGHIAFFIPAYLGLNQFKDPKTGASDVKRAKQYLEVHRQKLAKGKSATALEGEIINRPIKPSEIFLLKHGNIFPVFELQQRLNKVSGSETHLKIETVVDLFFEPTRPYGVGYHIDTKGLKKPIREFPFHGNDREGATVIYEFPVFNDKGKIPEDMYIIGHDPYASDDPSGGSLATIFVMKTKKYATKYGHDEIVATYKGRPYYGRNVVNEILLKLSMFYGNAKIYFENAVGNTKEYFEKKKKLSLLCKQPKTVFSNKAGYEYNSRTTVYGYPMSSRGIKMEAIHYLRDWLLEERGLDADNNPVYNLDRIFDIELLQELIAFNMDGNFDSVMGLVGCIVGMEESYNQFEEKVLEESYVSQIHKFFANNKNLFRTTQHSH